VAEHTNIRSVLWSCPLYNLAYQILRAAYIPGHQIQGADIQSRQGLRPREWRLHPEVVENIYKGSLARQKWTYLRLRKHTGCSGSPSLIQVNWGWMPVQTFFRHSPQSIYTGSSRVWFSDLCLSSMALHGRFPSRVTIAQVCGFGPWGPTHELWSLNRGC